MTSRPHEDAASCSDCADGAPTKWTITIDCPPLSLRPSQVLQRHLPAAATVTQISNVFGEWMFEVDIPAEESVHFAGAFGRAMRKEHQCGAVRYASWTAEQPS